MRLGRISAAVAAAALVIGGSAVLDSPVRAQERPALCADGGPSGYVQVGASTARAHHTCEFSTPLQPIRQEGDWSIETGDRRKHHKANLALLGATDAKFVLVRTASSTGDLSIFANRDSGGSRKIRRKSNKDVPRDLLAKFGKFRVDVYKWRSKRKDEPSAAVVVSYVADDVANGFVACWRGENAAVVDLRKGQRAPWTFKAHAEMHDGGSADRYRLPWAPTGTTARNCARDVDELTHVDVSFPVGALWARSGIDLPKDE